VPRLCHFVDFLDDPAVRLRHGQAFPILPPPGSVAVLAVWYVLRPFQGLGGYAHAESSKFGVGRWGRACFPRIDDLGETWNIRFVRLAGIVGTHGFGVARPQPGYKPLRLFCFLLSLGPHGLTTEDVGRRLMTERKGIGIKPIC